MGPPGFSECYICHREFGSRSLEFHEPQCLSKWRRDNRNLPKSDRQKTPSPLPNHSKVDSPSLSSQKPNPNGSERGDRPQSSTFMERRQLSRPSTAILDKPKVLDLKMKDEIDMSKMSRQMMENLVLQKDQQKGSSDYSSDFSSSSSSSMSSKSPCEEDLTSGESESENRRRPSTMRLKRPSSHIAVPVITPSTSRPLPRRGRTATIRSTLPLRKRLLLTEELLGTKEKIKIPEPCQTCGKEQNPERFHSHPRHLSIFKAKDKLSKDRNSKETPYKTISKLIVTKPTALKYKSRNFDSKSSENPPQEISKCLPTNKNKQKNIKNSEKRSKMKGKNPPKSLENSPHHETSSLKDFIEKKKSKLKEKKDLVEIYESTSVDKKSKSRKTVTKKQQDKEKEDVLTEMVPSNSKANKRIASGERLGTGPLKICYICGREFGTRSLSIHEPQCLEKWRRENDRLPEHLKREEPKRPEKELSKEEWNEYAWNMAQSQLVPCENCGRTFKPDRVEIHQRGCKPPPGVKKPQEQKESSSPKQFFRPTVVCYICGREFGSKSITIHEPQCLAKWKNENEKLPQHLQRPEPVKPETVINEDGRIDREAMAEAAWRTHLETLVKCEGCGRTFFPDRLTVHQKSCRASSS